jgi:hypothetical protein
MTTDEAYRKADRLLEKATQIWERQITEKYHIAEQCYRQAVEIRDFYFDNKKELTEDLCPF